MNNNHTHDFIPYVGEFEFAENSHWGQVIIMLAAGTARDESRIMRDPEAIRCSETGYSPTDIFIGTRQYTDDQLGVLDGPMRDKLRDEPIQYVNFVKRTGKATLSKRQRARLRKARRAAKRKGEAFSEDEFITLTFVRVTH